MNNSRCIFFELTLQMWSEFCALIGVMSDLFNAVVVFKGTFSNLILLKSMFAFITSFMFIFFTQKYHSMMWLLYWLRVRWRRSQCYQPMFRLLLSLIITYFCLYICHFCEKNYRLQCWGPTFLYKNALLQCFAKGKPWMY